MTHASVPAAHKADLGITPDLLRLSVGIEDIEDIIGDLEFALETSRPEARVYAIA
jgi:cystathionine beta-lyase/cystathionine gamma-synthase